MTIAVRDGNKGKPYWYYLTEDYKRMMRKRNSYG
jgi:hypothetical protein